VISSLFHLRPSSGLYGPAVGLLGLAIALVLLFVLSQPNASPTFAEQPNAVSYGLDYARGFGLVGDPAEITMAKMSYVEYRGLIGEEVLPYHREHNMEVWVLSMRGKVSLSMPGMRHPTECDNIFVVLDAQTGAPKAVGARNQALQLPGGGGREGNSPGWGQVPYHCS
jgi:hypothetical protein